MAADRSFAEQLGLNSGTRCWFHNLPEAIRTRLDAAALGIEEQPSASDGLQCAMLCAPDDETLTRQLGAVAPLLATNGFIWVWHSRDVAAERDRLGEIAAEMKLVITDTCTVDEKWSGLKLIAQ